MNKSELVGLVFILGNMIMVPIGINSQHYSLAALNFCTMIFLMFLKVLATIEDN